MRRDEIRHLHTVYLIRAAHRPRMGRTARPDTQTVQSYPRFNLRRTIRPSGTGRCEHSDRPSEVLPLDRRCFLDRYLAVGNVSGSVLVEAKVDGTRDIARLRVCASDRKRSRRDPDVPRFARFSWYLRVSLPAHAPASPGTPLVVEYSKCSASPGCTMPKIACAAIAASLKPCRISFSLPGIGRHVADREHAGQRRLAGGGIDLHVVQLAIQPPRRDRPEVHRQPEERQQHVGRQPSRLALQRRHLDIASARRRRRAGRAADTG